MEWILKYFSKEALFQHKNEKYLNNWLNKAIDIKNKTNIKEFNEYIKKYRAEL